METSHHLFSRVKSFFCRKATPVAAATPQVPPTNLSVVSAPRLRSAFSDMEKYLAENYGIPAAKLRYTNYSNGVLLVSNEKSFTLSLVILTTTNGAYNLPDNVLLLGHFDSDQDDAWLNAEASKFLRFLRDLGTTHRIQHLAIVFAKEKSDRPGAVKEPDITCVRLY